MIEKKDSAGEEPKKILKFGEFWNKAKAFADFGLFQSSQRDVTSQYIINKKKRSRRKSYFAKRSRRMNRGLGKGETRRS